MKKKYSVGIDLGTSNSALAISGPQAPGPQTVPLLQIVGPAKLAEAALLPSALYIAHESEMAQSAFDLPWEKNKNFCVGEYARERGSAVPDRVVLSAKSWLCNQQVDRREPILPWQSDLAERRVSPLDASRQYLEHMKAAFNHWCASQPEGINQDECDFVVAVPASFDEVARSLTMAAAEEAGLGKVTLLEEPLAAFYAWVSENRLSWQKDIKAGDIVLVCDVGGGTADFSLIAVSEDNGALRLDRISVGEHILLGGDNMDLALAVALRSQIEASSKKLDRWQFLSLINAARKAKEAIFSDANKTEVPIAIAGRGSSLFSSSVSTILTRELLEKVILEGFIPLTQVTDMPKSRLSAGLKEVGLPYASDAAISRHLAHFLVRSLETVWADEELKGLVNNFSAHEKSGFIRPSKVLFNGGVFKAEAVKRRIRSLLQNWCALEVPELPGAELDLAVARGAASYGLIRLQGEGLRIRAKTLRAYYLGVESSMPAVPGYNPPVNGLCVVPQGMEEGSSVQLNAREFGLVTGEAVEFRFFSSAVRASDKVGDLIEDAESSLEESARLEVTLPAPEGKKDVVPVQLHSVVTELGNLELWLRHTKSDRQWKLEFDVRGKK